MRCSLIIPVYNAEKTIVLCLQSALNQSLPKDDYEIIVVDDGSEDNSIKLIKQNFSGEITLINQHNQGPAAARNRGAGEAQGVILILTDSDCELDFNFLEKIIGPIEKNPEVVGVQGSYKTKQAEFIAHFTQVEIETRYRRMCKTKYIDFIGSYAAVYRKDIFEKFCFISLILLSSEPSSTTMIS